MRIVSHTGTNSDKGILLTELNPAEYSLDICYEWFFNMVKDGHKEELSYVFADVFLDAPKTFIQQYLTQRAGAWQIRKMWLAENEMIYAVARAIMMDRENSYLMRCGAYIMASNLLPEDEQYAFLKEVYDVYANEQHALQPNGREFFNLVGEKMIYGRDILREIELGYRIEAVDATWKVCYVETPNGGGMGYQFDTGASVISNYENYLSRVRIYTEDQYKLGIKTDVTNLQCPESFDQVCASVTESFFEDHVLAWVHLIDVKDIAPKVTKVDYDSCAFWNNPYQVYMECADRDEMGNMVEYVILVAIPKEQYRELEDHYELLYSHLAWSNVGCVLNGTPFSEEC